MRELKGLKKLFLIGTGMSAILVIIAEFAPVIKGFEEHAGFLPNICIGLFSSFFVSWLMVYANFRFTRQRIYNGLLSDLLRIRKKIEVITKEKECIKQIDRAETIKNKIIEFYENKQLFELQSKKNVDIFNKLKTDAVLLEGYIDLIINDLVSDGLIDEKKHKDSIDIVNICISLLIKIVEKEKDVEKVKNDLKVK